MRIQDRKFALPVWIERVLTPIGYVLVSPLIAVVFIAIGLAKAQEWLFGPSWYWRPWFAWHPVRVDPFEGQSVWLEWIERRTWYSQMLYRMPGDMNAFGSRDGERVKEATK